MNDAYQGWTNRETWAVNLHLSNDEGLYNEVNDLSEKFEWDPTKDAETIHQEHTLMEAESNRRGWTLQAANPKCRNCHGAGYVIARRYAGITHRETTYKMTCRCRKAPVEKPVLPFHPEDYGWMFGLD